MEINQKSYGRIEIDNTEKDIVLMWMFEDSESNVLQIERDNIDYLINLLNECKNGQASRDRIRI